jgi:hypothetical protein
MSPLVPLCLHNILQCKAWTQQDKREQGTLELVLTTPIRREELLSSKALAALVPSLAVVSAAFNHGRLITSTR